ncbi:MAG: protein kinase [Labilithrix sp.]|nr:protein kinase [Labilithrix sp.]
MWDNDGVFELSAGQIVADKYRIDGIMGTGGMGVVAAATHVELDQRVAIKFLRDVSPEGLARFQREARLLVRLKSAHVARVFDVGSLEDETPFIVMEHLEGSDLSRLAHARGRLPTEEAVDYVLQAMEAIAEAHALGMVHRDLKPANLFLAKGPGGTTTVKVLDFGVSKVLDDRASGANGEEPVPVGDLTNEGVALGSPGYMSPEQMTSARDVDVRSDVFSIGAMLYRLVTGQPPYRGTTIVSILAIMATEPLPPLAKLAPDAPPGFAEIVERCLAQDRVARWPSVAHLAQALAPFAGRRGRLAIEQIMATLGMQHLDDALGPTLAGPLTAPALTAPALGPTLVSPRVAPPRPPASSQPSPGYGPAPGFAATYRSEEAATPAAPSSRVPVVIAAGLLLFIVTAAGTWRALRPPHDDAAPSALPAAESAEALPIAPAEPPPIAAPTPLVAPLAPIASAEPAASETLPSKPKPPKLPPRQGGGHTPSSPGAPPALPPDRH